MPSSGSAKRKRETIDLTEDDDVTGAHHGQTSRLSQRSRVGPDLQSTSHQIVHTPLSSQNHGQHNDAQRQSWLADDDDVNEIVGSSQDDAEGTEALQIYGTVSTKIVGVQYYRGYANLGEHILMRREPGNPYDRNAIRIDNVAGSQIGHVPRKMAEKLARYMDAGELHMEGELAGNIGQFDCPLNVHMYGPDIVSDEGRALIERLRSDKLPIKAVQEAVKREKRREKEQQKRLAEARRAGGVRVPLQEKQSEYANLSQPSEDAEPALSDILEASQRFTPRDIGRAAEKYGIQEEDLKKMPMAPKPKAIRTEMLPYQLQALQWLIDQENPQTPGQGPQDSVQLWTRDPQRNCFTNLATKFSVKGAPLLVSGGILADDMGLGKTLEMISLIVADAGKSKDGPTLVVSPLSVMSNWSGQIAHHIHEKHALKVYTYHGAGRVVMQPKEIKQYDVVITTYQTLATEYMPRGKGKKQPKAEVRANGLYSLEWRRVILDEGHTVRNPQSKGAAAVTALPAKSRWILTGTPIVNSLKDLYSLLRFLGVSGGLENIEIFNSVLVRPLKQGDEESTYLLKTIMRAFTLRRRKDMDFIDLKLPKLDEYINNIEFTAKERERYDALDAEAKGLLANYQKKKSGSAKGTGETYQHLLEILLRMRQCCNHWQLCGERVTNLLAQLESQKTVDLTAENKKALQDMLQVQIESHEDCAICLEPLHQAVITTCAHAFCRGCIARVIETQHKCPLCRAELKDEACLVEAANECGDDDGAHDDLDLTASSSKLEGLMKILAASKTSGDKTVVFSQWTSFLDIVQARLDREGYVYCRLDGTMSAQKRDEAMQALERRETTVMLASLGVCAVGLNLTAANQIILADTWWAPAIEDQAVDRVHRLGQRKETRVFRLVMDDSVEQRTLEVQKDKRKLAMLAFSERSSKRDAARSGRLADIQKLLA